MTARTFTLERYEDPSGVSGTGVIADGVQWPDGSVSLRWRGEWPTITFHERGIDSVQTIHGHQGATEIRWQEDEPSRGGSTVERIVAGIQRTDIASVAVSFISGRAEIHAYMAADWLQWLAHLGGSPDAATKRDRPGDPERYPWEWSWTAPDGSVRVFYITADPDEIELENG